MEQHIIETKAFVKPIMPEIVSYNWEIWMQLDGVPSMPGRYLAKIEAYCEYARALGVNIGFRMDSENRIISDITADDEVFTFNIESARKSYIEQYRPKYVRGGKDHED